MWHCPESGIFVVSHRAVSMDEAIFTVGIKEQIIFPEIDYDKIDKIKE